MFDMLLRFPSLRKLGDVEDTGGAGKACKEVGAFESFDSNGDGETETDVDDGDEVVEANDKGNDPGGGEMSVLGNNIAAGDSDECSGY